MRRELALALVLIMGENVHLLCSQSPPVRSRYGVTRALNTLAEADQGLHKSEATSSGGGVASAQAHVAGEGASSGRREIVGADLHEQGDTVGIFSACPRPPSLVVRACSYVHIDI